MLISGDEPLKAQHFILPHLENSTPREAGNNLNMEDHERKLIIDALIQCNLNITHAAKLLGISRDTLIRKKKKYNITPEEYSPLMNGKSSHSA